MKEKIHECAKRFFSNKTTLIVCVAIGAVLWFTNAAFNFIDKDYRAFAINIMYATFLNILAAAAVRNANETVQGAIGGLLATFLFGNIIVLLEMAQGAPSRNLWQLIVSIILALGLFMNHFMLTSKRRRKFWRVKNNQILILLLLVLRVYQVLANIVGSTGVADLRFLIEVTVGLLAIIPTLNVVVCIECMTDTYKHDSLNEK